MKRTDIVAAIARKEITDRLRNKWILTVSVLLVVAAFSISFLGAVPVGLAGFQRSGMIMVSLINLAIYLVPLLALALGAFAIIDERERGTLDLILAYPVRPREYLAGSFLGLAVALGAAILVGFGLAGAVVIFQGGVVEIGQYLLFLVMTLLLGVMFLAISYTISILAQDKGRALAVSLLVWIGSVFLYDIVLVGALVASQGKIPENLFSGALMLNPVDLYRLLLFSLVDSARSPIGLLEGDLPKMMTAPILAAAFFAWLAALLLVTFRVFERGVSADLWSRSR